MTREEVRDPSSPTIHKNAHVMIKVTSDVCPPQLKITQQAKE